MSELLLDTHTFIWFSENAPNLSVALNEQIESADRVYLSIASLWEIAIKISIGKLTMLFWVGTRHCRLLYIIPV